MPRTQRCPPRQAGRCLRHRDRRYRPPRPIMTTAVRTPSLTAARARWR